MFVVAPAVGSYSSFELGDVNPLAVTLAGFSALSQPDHILVSWDTVSEVGNAGFALWRGPSPQARPQQLAFIPSQDPGSGQGFSYSYRDRDLVPGRTYWYWLDAVDLNGRAARYGPVSATYASPFNED
jgi:hypothetical protein